MAITFPRALPTQLLMEAMTMTLDPVEELAPTRGGSTVSVDLGPPLWTGKWQSPDLLKKELGPVRAWRNTLMSSGDFYGYDPLFQYPQAYRDFSGLLVGGSPFDGTCRLAEVSNSSLFEIGLSMLPVGFILTPGDMLSFDYSSGARRALHQVVAGGLADADGEMAVEIRPAIRPGYALNAVVQLYRPSARMIMDPKSYQETFTPPFYMKVAFTATQTLG